ncbi:MAG TPA: hypothetical protein VGF67_00450 [Ktedonobacteraceae bacterium]|jgi:hypothetical protein
MANRRLVHVGALLGLILALALLRPPVSARTSHFSTQTRAGVSFFTRISRARAVLQRRKAREQIIVVVIVSGRGFTPRQKFIVQNNVIIKANGRPQAVIRNAGGWLESVNNTTLTVQADDSGALSTDILVDLNGPAERAGTLNTIEETANVSESTGRQLAITGTMVSVTSQ